MSAQAPRQATSEIPATSRRVFLRGLLGVVGAGTVATVAGCDMFGSDEAEGPPATPPALVGFLAATSALGDQYDATLNAIDSLPATVGQIRDSHREHARALAQAIGKPTPSPAVAASSPPTDRAAALAALQSAEQAAHAAAVKECLDSPPRFAGLLASIAAARASHVAGLS